MKPWHRIVAAAAALVVTALLPAPAAALAQPSPVAAKSTVDIQQRYLLLMDISGSMADKDPKGRVKIEGAKDAARNALDGMTADALVALRTYPDPGADCGPGSKRYDFVEATNVGLRAAITSLPTGGQTPTGPALRAAADDLIRAGLTDGATIILVSDGLSNCGGDPCAVAKEIAAQGLAIVNTVGFQISTEGQKELACVADATGGKSFSADNSDALKEAIEDAATPRLSITLTSPEPNGQIPPGHLVSISATVANVSKQTVDRVQALLRFDRANSHVDPGVPGPLRSLGNLLAGERRVLTWQYRAGADLANLSSQFTVTALGSNASPVKATQTIRYTGALGIGTSTGPILGTKNSHVVIVGDSFSSGEGAGSYDILTDWPDVNQCHRSTRTYATTLGYNKAPTVLACSGATTANLLDKEDQWNEKESQIERLGKLSDPADVVLMTIGGNDVDFKGVIIFCVIHSSCHDDGVTNPEVTPECSRAYLLNGAYGTLAPQRGLPVLDIKGMPDVKDCAPLQISYEKKALATIPGIHRDLLTSYARIDAAVNGPFMRGKRHGKIAPIIVLAYPMVMPLYATSRSGCSIGLSGRELQFGQEFTQALNDEIASAVKEAHDDGLPIFFASDVQDAVRPNHTLCDSDPHINKIDIGNALLKQTQELMHPTAEGYKDFTTALSRWSNRPEILTAKIERHVYEIPVSTARPPSFHNGVLTLTDAPSDVGAKLLQGEAVNLQGGGFAPSATVTFTIQSAPRFIGQTTAANDGTVRGHGFLPDDLTPGLHTIVATGFDPDGKLRQQLLIVEISRPFPVLPVVLVGLALLLVLAAGWELDAMRASPRFPVPLWRRRRSA